MRKGILACVITSLIFSNPLSFDFKQYSKLQQTAVAGKISPQEASETALIIHATDTIKTPIVWGNFSQQVKPGIYKLIVFAKAPFKNAELAYFEVKKNHVLNVGELILQR